MTIHLFFLQSLVTAQFRVEHTRVMHSVVSILICFRAGFYASTSGCIVCFENTVEPHYNEVLGTMKITLLYQVSHYIRVKKTKKYKELGPEKLPCYKRVFLYPTSL